MSKKVLITITFFIVSLCSINLTIDKSAEAYKIKIYSMSHNQHGGIVILQLVDFIWENLVMLSMKFLDINVMDFGN